jgi:phosphohistidine phosphatase SixA
MLKRNRSRRADFMRHLERRGVDQAHLMAFAVEPFSGCSTLASVSLQALTLSQG